MILTTISQVWEKLEPLAGGFSFQSICNSSPAYRKKQSIIFDCVNPYEYLTTTGDSFEPFNRGISERGVFNPFQDASMKLLGGGEERARQKCALKERCGGGHDDNLKYIRLHDKPAVKAAIFKVSIEDICIRMGVNVGSLTPTPLDDVVYDVVQNGGANPGPMFSGLGFKSKLEAMPIAWGVARKIVKEASERPILGRFVPRYIMNGRKKLKDKTSFQKKLEEGKPLGRPVEMADQHEQIIGAMYMAPLLDATRESMKSITLGFNKYSTDPTKVYEDMKNSNVYLNGDFSGFDKSVDACLQTRFFDVVRALYGVPRGRGDVHDHILDWLEDQYINTRLVSPSGKAFKSHGGVPSGTCFTAMGDSVINLIAWLESEKAFNFTFDSIKVNGDDCLIGMTVKSDSRDKYAFGKEVLKNISTFLFARYKLVLDPDKSKVSTEFLVGYAQPRVPGTILDGSSQVLADFRREQEKVLGRKLSFEESFILLDDEPIGAAPGRTHRWSYLFRNRASFLSYYFKADKSAVSGGMIMMVRPTQEVLDRLYNPEFRIKSLYDHEMRLQSAVIENMGNHHVINRIMHYVHDSMCLRRAGINKVADLWRLRRKETKSFDNHYLRKRGWYRRIEDQAIDLLEEDQEFKSYFSDFLKRAYIVHGQTYGSRYTDWSRIRLSKMGNWKLGPFSIISKEPSEMDLLALYGDYYSYKDIPPLTKLFLISDVERKKVIELTYKQMEFENFNYDCAEVRGISTLLAQLRNAITQL